MPSPYTVYQNDMTYRELAEAKNELTDSGTLRKINKRYLVTHFEYARASVY
jgi:hypothetical protein